MLFFFSSRRRHRRFKCDWSSDVCSSDLFLAFSFLAPQASGLTKEKAIPTVELEIGVAPCFSPRSNLRLNLPEANWRRVYSFFLCCVHSVDRSAFRALMA